MSRSAQVLLERLLGESLSDSCRLNYIESVRAVRLRCHARFVESCAHATQDPRRRTESLAVYVVYKVTSTIDGNELSTVCGY